MNYIRLARTLVVVTVLALLMPGFALAGGPSAINYEGYLTNSSGDPQNGTPSAIVRLYDSPTSGTLLFEELHPSITIDDGYFTIAVGTIGDISGSTVVSALSELAFNVQYYITTEIGAPFNTGEMTLSGGQRTPIALSPYAYSARALTTAAAQPTGSINTGQVYYDTVLNTAYVYDGVSWVPLSNPATNSVTSSAILDGTIALADLSIDSVGASNIVDGSIGSADITMNSLLFNTLQQVGAEKLLGNSSGIAGDIAEIGIGNGVMFSAGNLSIDSSDNFSWTGLHTVAHASGLQLLPFGISAGSTTPLRFAELSTNGAHTVGFRAPDSVTSDVVWQLPGSDGSSGQVIGTNGSGVLSWMTPLAIGGNAIGGVLRIGTNDAHPVVLESNNVEAIRIDSAGRTGFNAGTTHASGRMYVRGSTGEVNVLSLERAENSGSGLGFTTFRRGDGTELGYISCNASGLSCSLVSASDRRVKHSVTESELGLDAVMRLGVKQYAINGDDTNTLYQGFIAQELVEIYPEAVSQGDDADSLSESGQMWGVDYGRITPLLARAIQEQQVILNGTEDLLTSSSDINAITTDTVRSPVDRLLNRISIAGSVLSDVVSARISAIYGYFDTITTRQLQSDQVTTDTLCIGTDTEQTCIDKDQIDMLLQSTIPVPVEHVATETLPPVMVITEDSMTVTPSGSVEHTAVDPSNVSVDNVISNSDTLIDTSEQQSDSVDTGAIEL